MYVILEFGNICVNLREPTNWSILITYKQLKALSLFLCFKALLFMHSELMYLQFRNLELIFN